MKSTVKVTPLLLLLICPSVLADANKILKAQKVASLPTVDGVVETELWDLAPILETEDGISGNLIKLRSLYDDQRIHFLVQFEDESPNDTHKTMHWNASERRYITGSDREDTFIFKFSMNTHYVDLSISSEQPYQADVWYWKVHRGANSGYADDKMHIYSRARSKKSKMVIAKNGQRFYLDRPSDEGEPTYKVITHGAFTGETVGKYSFQKPTGSRADIKAVGRWENGLWTVEFSRALNTGYDDDVQFQVGTPVQFGVSIFEIAGRKPNPKFNNPNYGAGEISEKLTLQW